MEGAYIGERLYSYMFYALAAFAFLAGLSSYDPYLALTCSALLAFSAIYYRSGAAINAFMLKRRMVIEIVNGYVLGRDGSTLVRRLDGSYHALAVAELHVDEGSNRSPGAMASVLDSIREPFEYSVSIKEADSERLLDRLTERRRSREIRLSRIGSGQQERRAQLEREIEVISKEISGISSSGKPLELAICMRTFATDTTESGASGEALRLLGSVCAVASATLGLRYEVLRGERLLSTMVLR